MIVAVVADVMSAWALFYAASTRRRAVVRFLEQQSRGTVIDARLERAPFFESDDIPCYDHHPGALANDTFFHLMRAYLDGTRR